jgi:hypothetical protein
MSELCLMLIKVNPNLTRNAQLAAWIDEIDADYMSHFPLMPSAAHVKLDGPWDFALLFRATEESIAYLEAAIRNKGPEGSIAEILSMRATDLDNYTASLR